MLSSTLWIGCSPVADEGRNDSASPSKQVASGKLPFQVTWIESGEEREKRDIQQKAKALFASRDFDALDALAGSHRESKACYANGVWKLNEVHVGLQLPREASDAAWKTHLATLRNWTESKPESITARTKLAAELVSYAWRARGGGYAKTVSQEGWTVFRANLNEARSVLTAARSLKAKCPRWWSSMMQVATV